MADRNEHGRARTVAGSIQDVHEQKLTEDALQHAQQRFERAIKGTQDGLWEMDADGSAWCSPRVAELLERVLQGQVGPASLAGGWSVRQT
jgi:PAS domain-containing protein